MDQSYNLFRKKVYKLFPSITEEEYKTFKEIFVPEIFSGKKILSEFGINPLNIFLYQLTLTLSASLHKAFYSTG